MTVFEKSGLILAMFISIAAGCIMMRIVSETEARERAVTRCADIFISTWPEGMISTRYTATCKNLTYDELGRAYLRAMMTAEENRE